MSQDSHLRVGSHDISFKSHVKSLGVYIDATLAMDKHIDHISRSAYLEIRRINSVRHLLTRKATVQLMCSFVLSRSDYCNVYSLTSLLIKCTTFKKFKIMQPKSFFAKANMSMLHHLKKLHWLPVKERILFKIATFAFHFFDGALRPYCQVTARAYIIKI